MLDAPAEVTNFEDILVSNKQVFRLEIPVNKAVFVKEVNPGHSLNEEIKCLILRKPARLVANDVEQIALLRILQNQVNKVLVLQRGVAPHNVRVLQFLLNLDLPS